MVHQLNQAAERERAAQKQRARMSQADGEDWSTGLERTPNSNQGRNQFNEIGGPHQAAQGHQTAALDHAGEGGEPGRADHDMDRIQSKLALWDADEQKVHAATKWPTPAESFQPSDRIYVMGLDLAGRYIAHTLAGCHTIPPVRFMLHTRSLFREWANSRRQVTMYRGNERIDRGRVIPEYLSLEQIENQSGSVIENLVVTLPPAHVVRVIGQIKHRLDHRSSICLINQALGVEEALIAAHFPDELRRPAFIQGHLTTSLTHTDDRFSIQEVRQGRLFLSLFTPHNPEPGERFRVKRHPPPERTIRHTHLLRLLTAMPGLHATGHSFPEFLQKKLPTVIFRTVADPLAALFNCRYEHLRQSRYARWLMDQLIGELARIVSLLPECRESPRFRQIDTVAWLRKEMDRRLMLKRTADSKMRAQFVWGWATDIEFLSGYFINRGRELHADVSTLESVMAAAKAKQALLAQELAGDIPFEEGASTDVAQYQQ
ncbi:hypothetical protein B0J18DRAFT_96422 [Chaetomium sp. MPI-SDFR-AT-0129]|nr:hypothetical protein B0J18DRAFT_96422 [Chaetomium sp. MPI-SDFR-AT-0129]